MDSQTPWGRERPREKTKHPGFVNPVIVDCYVNKGIWYNRWWSEGKVTIPVITQLLSWTLGNDWAAEDVSPNYMVTPIHFHFNALFHHDRGPSKFHLKNCMVYVLQITKQLKKLDIGYFNSLSIFIRPKPFLSVYICLSPSSFIILYILEEAKMA